MSQRGREGADAPPAVGCPKALQGWWESVGFARDRKHQRLGYPLTRRRERDLDGSGIGRQRVWGFPSDGTRGTGRVGPEAQTPGLVAAF